MKKEKENLPLPEDFRLSSYDYFLPEELIAKEPLKDRDAAKLMILHRKSQKIEEDIFRNLYKYLPEKTILVMNNVRVVPARFYAMRNTGGIIEFLYISSLDDMTIQALAKPFKRIKKGERLTILYTDTNGHYLTQDKIEVLEKKDFVSIRLPFSKEDFLNKYGNMPIPPYIKKRIKEKAFSNIHKEYYQTIYASSGEAIAAPTAGLHFTNQLIKQLKDMGFVILYLTLDISYATFKSVEVKDIREHKIHKERYFIPNLTANKINELKKEGWKVVAVGTTTTRALESSFKDGKLYSGHFETSLFIYPGYRFKVVDGLITNFHLPRSSLIMLVSAFAGRSFIMKAYEMAIKKRYRFYSYGDAMLIL